MNCIILVLAVCAPFSETQRLLWALHVCCSTKVGEPHTEKRREEKSFPPLHHAYLGDLCAVSVTPETPYLFVKRKRDYFVR